ncbi:13189_t:CDS:2 [Acaulospora colombiana]|uniref:13189_t:CDS:1 n=1 Tax=Acaulospora colombiana TaxID=27376 RepID=A0ACA9K4Z9_9GLOM|nr:13189_t:CDS:2 [Acaulospora colombiana]
MMDPKRTLKQYGIIQDEMLYIRRRSPAPSDVTEAEQFRHTLLGNPHMLEQLRQTQLELANAVNDPVRFATLIQQMMQRRNEGELQRAQQISLLNADPFNIEAQRMIEENIRLENVMANFDVAMEHTPESFGRVTMLYIDVEVNKHPVKAFVDSGAQTTIRTAKILGKIHSVPIRMGNDFLPCWFTIIEGRGVELLFGLDMLKGFQHELPEYARTDKISEVTRDESSSSTSAMSNMQSSQASGTTSNSISNSSPSASQSRHPEEHINNLVSMGISRTEAIKLLDAANGNVEMAASLYFGE